MKEQIKEKKVKSYNVMNNQVAKVALAASLLLTGATSTISTVGPNNGLLGEWMEINHAEAASVFAGGTGTVADPYLVSNKNQLSEINTNLSSHFKLTSNIDLSGVKWTPIGNQSYAFTGSFNGNGHTINGLTVEATGYYTGLFGNVTGDIQNIHLTNVNVKGSQNVGGLAGYTSGNIQSVSVEGVVVGTGANVGGVVGTYQTAKKITDVASAVHVTGTQQVGGVVGYMAGGGTAQNVFSTGDVTGTASVGGIAGYTQSAKLLNIYSTGDVTGNSLVGGLVGQDSSYSTITNAYATGSVKGNLQTGGLVGLSNYGTLSNLYALNKSVVSNTLSNSTGKAIGHYYGQESNVSKIYVPETSKGVGMQQFVTHLLTNKEVKDNETYEAFVKTGVWEMDTQSSLPVLSFNKRSVQPLSLNDKVNYVKKDGVIYAAINTASELAQMNNSLNVPYLLMNDIDLSGVKWKPIGDQSYPFTGSFNGDGHTINGLTVEATGYYTGLFGNVTGDIQNIHLTNVNVKGSQNVGGLAGYTSGNIQSVSVEGVVVGTGANVGGVVGTYQTAKKITDVASSVHVTGTQQVGGVVGYMAGGGTAQNVFSTGDVTGTASVGGIAGYTQSAKLLNIYSTGDVTGKSHIGGLVGQDSSYSTITNAYATGAVKGDLQTGGLVGLSNYGTLSNLYALNKSVVSNTLSNSTGKAIGHYYGQESNVSKIYVPETSKGVGMQQFVTHLLTNKEVKDNATYEAFVKTGVWEMDTKSNLPVLSFAKKSVQPLSLNDKVNYVKKDGVIYAAINTASELAQMNNSLNVPYLLMNDIDLSGVKWTPIGDQSYPFTGSFNGDGHTINGLTVESTGYYTGLFGNVTGDIQNIHLTNVNVKGSQNVGGLVGYTSGNIQSVSVEGVVVGTGANVGGVVGTYQTAKKITDVASAVHVTGTQQVGGVVGYMAGGGTAQNVFSTGDVTGTASVGGIAGYTQSAKLSNMYSTGDVTANSLVGGLVGQDSSYSTITNAYATGTVKGNSQAGGLVGLSNYGTLSNLYALNKSVVSNTLSNSTGKAIGHYYGQESNVSKIYVPETSKGVGMQQFVTHLLTNKEVKDNVTYEAFVKTGVWEMDTQSSLPVLSFNKRSVQPLSLNDKVNYVKKDGVIYAAINTASELAQMNNSLNVPYLLMNDIDLSGVKWKPIGDQSYPFTGSFNGDGHTINGLTVEATGYYTGLFGNVTGDIQNIHLTNVNVKGSQNVGGLAGYTSGNIQSVYVEGVVVGTGANVGGVIGTYQSAKKITDVASSVDVTGTQQVGGVVGYMAGGGTAQNVFSTGDVTGTASVGGIAGYTQSAKLSNMYSTGDMTANSYVGGLVGQDSSYSTITNGYATGSVKGNGQAGGLVGLSNYGTLSNLYALNKSVVSTDGSNTTNTTTGKAFGTSYGTTSSNIKAIDSMSGTGHIIGITGEITATQAMQKKSYLGLDFGGTEGLAIWKIDEGTSIPYLAFQPKPMKFNPGDGTWGEIDFTPPNPATFSTSTTEWTKDSVLLTVHFPKDAKVQQIRIDNGSWKDYTEPILIEKNATVDARSYDAAENESSITNIKITNIDKEIPVISTVSTTNGKLVIQATDSGSGLKLIEYRLNGQSWSEYTTNISLVGDQLIEIRATDKVGNVSDVTSHTYVDEAVAIAIATTAVLKAEGTKAQVDVDTARTLIEALSTGTAKTDLTNRLNVVQKAIEDAKVLAQKIVEATASVVKAEESRIQGDVNSARNLVYYLPNGTEKTDLTNRLNSVQKEIDDEIVLANQIAVATTSVTKAEGSKLQTDVDSAKVLVTALPSGTAKTDLTSRLNIVQKAIDDGVALLEQIAKATASVLKAEEYKTQADVDVAMELVSELSASTEKTDLTNRLNIVQKEIDDAKSLSEQIVKAIEAVVKAETTKLVVDYNSATELVAALPTGTEKTMLIERLNLVQKAIDEAVALSEQIAIATTSITKAENSMVEEDIEAATTLITALPEIQEKVDLLKRLDIIKEKIKEGLALKEAEEVVNNLGKTPTQAELDAAKERVRVLSESPAKEILLDKIQAKQDALDKANAEIVLAEQIRLAVDAVEDTEASMSLVDMNNARNLVEKLPSGDVKKDLNSRLDKVQNAIDAAESLETIRLLVNKLGDNPTQARIDQVRTSVENLSEGKGKDELLELVKAKQDVLDTKIAEAEKAVQAIGSPPSQKEIDNAQVKVDFLPTGDIKDGLQERINEHKKNLVDKDKDLLLKATNAVVKAEEFPTNYNITIATSLVASLSANGDKTSLLNRLQDIQDKLAVEKAEIKVKQAENYESDPYLKEAIAIVDALKDSREKQELKNRLQTLMDKLEEEKDEVIPLIPNEPVNPGNPTWDVNKEIAKVIDAEAKLYFTNWNKAVVNAEKYPSNSTIKNTKTYLEGLPNPYKLYVSYDSIIQYLTERTVKLGATIEQPTEDIFAPIEKAVVAFEKYQTNYYLNKAIELVNSLPDSKEKKAFGERLGLNKVPTEDPAENAEQLALKQAAEKAVANYEKYKSAFYQKKATEAIKLIANSEEKAAFQARLDAVNK